MKKKILAFWIIFTLFFVNSNVLAKEFNCYYERNKNGLFIEQFELIINTDNNTIQMVGGLEEGTSITGIKTFDIDNLKQTWFEKENKDTCMDIFLCYKYTARGGNLSGDDYDYYLFTSKEEAKKVIPNYTNLEIDTSTKQKEFYCTTMEKKDKTCDKYINSKRKLEEYYKEYKNCSDSSCRIPVITNINKEKEIIKSYCNQVTQNLDYNKECTADCLNISEQLQKWENENGITSGNINGECGFSGRLLAWISNILRWAKYILPVLVMVLGILDFMKAMGADKEDEMKKAQGRFVKRLIAAALVFLIPLILEFVLDKMGFGYDSCGLF